MFKKNNEFNQERAINIWDVEKLSTQNPWILKQSLYIYLEVLPIQHIDLTLSDSHERQIAKIAKEIPNK